MAKWYIKELSKLTGVSVQTLHYYDRIDLLKPSVRLDNGYRMYSEGDLLKLQQIIALKFFSFELSQIREILSNPEMNLSSLENQANLLAKKANSYIEASKALNKLVDEVATKNNIPWQSLIKTIEVYKMAEQLDNPWVKEIFNHEELEQYATFENAIKQDVNKKKAFEQSWKLLIEDVKLNINEDPTSDIGIKLGEKFMEWVNSLYGKEYAHLRTKMFEQGFGEGKGIDGSGMTPEIIGWLEKAMDAYWRQRIYSLLDRVGNDGDADLLAAWNSLLDDMYGDQDSRKAEIYKMAQIDTKISEAAKAWLKTIS